MEGRGEGAIYGYLRMGIRPAQCAVAFVVREMVGEMWWMDADDRRWRWRRVVVLVCEASWGMTLGIGIAGGVCGGVFGGVFLSFSLWLDRVFVGVLLLVSRSVFVPLMGKGI